MKKNFLLLIFLACAFFAVAQSKKEIEVLAQAKRLEQTVFGTRDSLTLESLFAKTATYGHSGGKLQTREEAITEISHNHSVYNETSIPSYQVLIYDGHTAIVRTGYTGTETHVDGTVTQLHLGIILVWVKEKGDWKLFGRQASKLPDTK
jgi:hypothetical protein